MVRTVDDQRFTPFTGMARRGAKFTIAVMHAVIHHTLFFRLDQERRRVIIAYARQHLLTGMNTFPHPVPGGAADPQTRFIGIKTQVAAITLPTVG